MSINVEKLLRSAGVTIRRLDNVLKKEKERSAGELPQNLSPYGAIVQALLHNERAKMESLLCDRQRRFTVWIPAELEFPPNMDRATFVDVVILPD